METYSPNEIVIVVILSIAAMILFFYLIFFDETTEHDVEINNIYRRIEDNEQLEKSINKELDKATTIQIYEEISTE